MVRKVGIQRIHRIWWYWLWRLRVRVRVGLQQVRVGVRVTAGVRVRVTKGRLTRSQSSPSQTGFIPEPYLFLLGKI